MKTKVKLVVLSFLLLSNSLLTIAGSGDDHTHRNEKPTAVTVQQKYFSTEAVSDKYELLLRYEPIQVGKTAHLTLFVSEYATNKPVDKADLKITAREDDRIVFAFRQTDEGRYELESKFFEKKSYSLAVKINSSIGADLILLRNIEAGKDMEHEGETDKKTAMFSWQVWLAALVALIIGLGLGVMLQKRNTNSGKKFISGLFLLINCLLPITNSNAHEGHDEQEKKTGNNFSPSFSVPKETQFLFNVYTQKTATGTFTESTKLFGTIIPSSSGQAIITSPQSGKIISLFVRVGEQVKAGQLLAVIEQNIDAASQVNLLTERNNIIAEYDAAKKEFERYQSIRDIAARRDVDEATARFQKAESNLKLFNSNTGKTIHMKAPISGVVGNFNLSIGGTVSSGQKLFTITNLMHIYAEAQVFDRDAGKVAQGSKFTIECANDCHKSSEVKLLSLAQEINATNQSQRVLFELTNSGSDFKIGEFVNIRVFAAVNSQKMVLPNSAITEMNGKPVVFIKESAENYKVSYVQLGENNGTFTTLLKGVEEGQRVVTNASYQLKMIYLNQ